MDSLKPTEILVSFSCLSYWNESPVVIPKDDPKPSTKLGVRDKSDRESRLGDVPILSESNLPSEAHAPVTVAGNSCTRETSPCELCYFVLIYVFTKIFNGWQIWQFWFNCLFLITVS